MKPVREFIAAFIKAHEGGLSLDPKDNGNWFDPKRLQAGLPQARYMGKLVGSKYGITAYALANYRKVANISAADIANLKFEEAVEIGVRNYYSLPRFNVLPWDRVIAAALDASWLSGTSRGVKLLQQTIGATADGILGPATARAYTTFREKYTEAQAADRFADQRNAFYLYLASNEGPNDPDKRFLNGWRNRSNSFRPGTAWWKANA